MEENIQLIQSPQILVQKHTKNVIDALINESKIMYEGLNNQEFIDYCFVKGACAQTVPLALLLPIGLFLGIINILTKSVANIAGGGSIFSNFVFVVLQICALCIVLFLLLKACEVIPKKIENPLLFGKVTTYVFMCLQITMGVLVVEKIIDGEAQTFHTSQFWVVFALVIWEKVLALFIYDFKIRFATFLFLYIYYAFRISSESYQWSYNLIKASVYIAIELVLVIDRELKNMAEYQLENNVHKKSTLKEMIPPLKMFQQQSLLESFLQVYPVVIFDQTKELLNISAQTLKILGQEDLIQAERQLRKLEVIEVFNKAEQVKEQQNRLARQAKFGSSCGVNDKGELLHSLINGPALQQIRNQQQDLPRLQPSGQLETLLNDLIKGDQEQLKGLLMIKISKEKQIYFQFQLFRNQKIYLFLDDVTELIKLQLDKSNQIVGTTDFSDINNLCSKIRQAASTNEPLLQTSFLNIETKNSYAQQMPLRVNYNKINFEQLAQNLTDFYKPRVQSVKFYVKNLVNLNTEFFSDEDRIKQIIDSLMENSIQKTKEGFIGITIENDPRPNQIQVTIQDTGSGIPLEELNSETNDKYSSLFVANYLSKILGQSYYNQKIKGYIASKGLRITTLQECGSQISFSLRNMTFDQNNNGFLLDENFEEEETNSDEILDRYLVDDETQHLKRMKKPIKFILMKPQIKKPIAINEDRGIIKRPQLKGMMKLQESGRLKSLQPPIQALPLQIDQLGTQQCNCQGILMINSDFYFEKTIKDLPLITCVENEALKLINIKLKENPCIPVGCNAYKRVIINCSNSKVNYEELIRKLQTLIKNLNVSVLHYQPWGEVLPNLTYYQMPTALDHIMN